jgi:hypothetical protein
VIHSPRINDLLALALLLPLGFTACRKEEQAVKGVAQSAVNIEQKAQANASELDLARAEVAKIPLPTKSMYIDVRELALWGNPFLSVGPEIVTLRIVHVDANTSTAGQGTLLRPQAARREEMPLRLSDLRKAIVAIPADAWPFGRVIAIAESPDAGRKDRPKARRNVEAVIRQLNDLGIVVQEWPTR